MSRLRAGEQADAPGGWPGGPGPRALTLRPRGCSPSWEGRTGRAGTRPERRGSHSRSRPRPRLPRSPSHRPPPASLFATSFLDLTTQPCTHPNENPLRSLQGAGENVCSSGPCTVGHPARGWERRRQECCSSSGRGRGRGHLWSPGTTLPISSSVPCAARANSGGSWLQSFRERRGLVQAKRRAGCGPREARTEALLAASLFCSGRETWRGVAGRVPGPSAATFRTQQGLFAPSRTSSFRHPPPPPQPWTLVPGSQASLYRIPLPPNFTTQRSQV